MHGVYWSDEMVWGTSGEWQNRIHWPWFIECDRTVQNVSGNTSYYPVSHGELRSLFALCELVKYMRVQLMMERQVWTSFIVTWVQRISLQIFVHRNSYHYWKATPPGDETSQLEPDGGALLVFTPLHNSVVSLVRMCFFRSWQKHYLETETDDQGLNFDDLYVDPL